MTFMKKEDIGFDKDHIWHPYASMINPIPVYPVISGHGSILILSDGSKIIDGMSSWWSVIHGYNNAILNKAAKDQIKKISHVMFGGITHNPAINLCKCLIDMIPSNLECVFLSDSGSVSVEVALKMAIQYWNSIGKKKNKFLSFHNGYHGDTFLAVSVSDPKNSYHDIYNDMLPKNFFAKSPKCGFYEKWNGKDTCSLETELKKNSDKIAAVIIEPIVQGAGGMKIYHPEYLKNVRRLCNYFNTLLIVDEIATGFGRTGKMFAFEYSSIVPDILCLGKALTGGYITLSATITTRHIANTISNGKSKCLMHGPTFMGNPLACSIAYANLKLLKKNEWKNCVKEIENQLMKELYVLKSNKNVVDVRILGAIAVVEMKKYVNLVKSQEFFIKKGVWIRPFKNLIYIMPSYVITKKQLTQLINAIKDFVINE